MQQQRGFTLIELIIVIVILGILAVTAAPKFIDIQGDATSSTLQGVKAAVQGSSQLVYAKAALAGKQKTAAAETPSVEIQGIGVLTDYGYPNADTNTDNAELAKWVDISANDFTLVAGTGNADTESPALGAFAIIPASGSPTINYALTGATDASCHVLYTGAEDANTPATVIAVTGGC